MNRTKAPKTTEINDINFVMPSHYELQNGIPVYEYNFDAKDVISIDFIFPAGTYFQDKPLLARAVTNTLEEGTKKLNSKEIANEIDYYGAYLQNSLGNNNMTFSLVTLTKNLENTFPIFVDIIQNAQFPEKELKLYLDREKQNHKINMNKVEVIASREFHKYTLGISMPTPLAQMDDFDKITSQDCQDFFKKQYRLEDLTILISGGNTKQTKRLLETSLGDLKLEQKSKPYEYKEGNYEMKKITIEKKDAVQSAIRIGKPTINVKHPDFIKAKVLNTLFGGYFGSRLMANIREDKGYTYGIGSYLQGSKYRGGFGISTEVGKEVTQPALDEIFKEIEIIKTELVTEEELSKVKNYMLGSLLNGTDGVFDMMDRFRAVYFNNQPDNYYQKYIQEIKETTPEDILSLAKKYYTNFTVVVVGSINESK